jgi:23S rRNA (cytosine1962-C5)-methyltransferase
MLDFQEQYKLLDFGNGMRLEQFGKYRVCRPCPTAAEEVPSLPRSEWNIADIAFQQSLDPTKSKHSWRYAAHVQRERNNVKDWSLSSGNRIHFKLNTYDGGQVGIFPEQYQIWQWIEKCVLDYMENAGDNLNIFRVLNGFAFTGGSTMASIANSKVQVTHLDASKNAIKLAQQNVAEIDSSTPQSVRWLTDDCTTFIDREIKRIADPNTSSRHDGYHGLIFDPPAFGRDRKGNSWKLNKDFPRLFERIPALLHQVPAFIVLSCHDPQWPRHRLVEEMNRCLPASLKSKGLIEAKGLFIPQEGSSRRLYMGNCVRWSRKLIAHR